MRLNRAHCAARLEPGTEVLLILDEPTSVLPPLAVDRLFGTLRQLAAEGCSILYISHKLDEIQSLCHAATVLRAGRVTGTVDPRRESAQSLARMMIGKDLPAAAHPDPSAEREERLVVSGLSLPADDPFGTRLTDVRLSVHSGEIVGIAGVSGNGQKELMTVLSGERLVEPPEAVRLCGVPAGGLGPRARRTRGLAFVPEERLGRGAVPPVTLAENALLTAAHLDMVRSGFVRVAQTRAFAARCIQACAIRGPAGRTLRGLVRAGGLMRIGLYSETARRHVVRARELIAGLGLASTPEGIRAGREAILARRDDPQLARVAQGADFYSLSGMPRPIVPRAGDALHHPAACRDAGRAGSRIRRLRVRRRARANRLPGGIPRRRCADGP